jgi:transposase
MARPASVFVRPLRRKERLWLRRVVRRGGDGASAVTWRRALVVSMSGRRDTATEIAASLSADDDWVRDVIHEFNRVGLEALIPAWGGGRPRVITTEARARILEVVKCRPQELGEPWSVWSLSHLRDYLLRSRVVAAISKERLRVILIEEGFTTQRTKGWKRSPDPDFAVKAARLKRLYRLAESGRLNGVLVCFDEHGPVTPTPKPGRDWSPRDRPRRIRANYRKPHGVRFFFGVYDVAADMVFGRWFARKGADHVLVTLRLIRRRYPSVHVWVVQDNLSAHWTDEIRTWATNNNVTLVPTPTYASWLNRIECEFGAMVGAIFEGSDYASHDEIQAVTARYLRRRNADARRHREQRRTERDRRRRRRAAARRARPDAAA